jgi:endonuclease/exonuclease/phosphatase family metal-dependent hydrolase
MVLSTGRSAPRAPRLGAAALALAAAACGAATNYLDPGRPVYETHHAGAPGGRVAEGPLRVVTFNIEYAIRVDEAIAVLRETPELQRLDVLALQEMDSVGVERIASALGLESFYAPGGVHPSSKRDFGCALLSPWPLEEPRKLRLPHASRGSGLVRSVTSAVLVRGPERIRVYSVHLPSPLAVSGGSRRDQLRTLAEDASGATEPVIIAGDFNSHDKVSELEKAGFSWVTREVGATTRVELFGREIMDPSFDHVLARGFRAEAFGVVEKNRGASDHLPVWALLEREGSKP